MKRSRFFSGCCALVLGISQMAYAAPEKGVTLNLGAGRYYYDHDRDIDNATALQGGIGYLINKHWALEAVFTDLSEQPFGSPATARVEGEMLRLDALYHLKPNSSDLQPYFALGVGELELESAFAKNDETVYNAGIGFKKHLNDVLAIRGDARALYTDETEDLDGLVTIGLNFLLGGSSSKAAAAPAPVAAGPGDADNDGVTDDIDQCPGTPAGIAVDSVGCPLDGDGDGVYDQRDQCPDTPAGARVDEKGCQYVIKETVQVELEVLFDTNQATVKPVFVPEIKRVAEFMKLFPATKATIEGHTDSRGDAAYNQQLSQRRADAVRSVLITQHGIAADRIKAVGFGEDRPRASNETAEGQLQNRRVIAEIKTEVEKKAN